MQGELHIEVAHNPAQPLTGLAAGQIMQAMDTAFNVKLNRHKVELIVAQGSGDKTDLN